MDPALPAKGRDRLKASRLDLFFLGITIVIGGQYFAWNAGLIGGFTQFLVGTFMMGFGYLNMVLCLAEMTSTLPFAGGTYGFVRVALGPFAGFLVGYCESILNILYVTTAVMSLGGMLSDLTRLHRKYEPIYWIAFFVVSFFINVRNGQLFWNTNATLALISMVVLFSYVVGSSYMCDYEKYALSSDAIYSTSEKVHNVFEHLPLTAWWYVGVEMLPLTSQECAQPKKDIPVAMVCCIVYLLASSIAVLFVAGSQAPGPVALSDMHAPLSIGFSGMFSIDSQTATLFTIPATFATAFGFIYNYRRQLDAIYMSGLIPSIIPNRYWSSSYQSLGYLLTGLVIALVILFLESYQAGFHAKDIFLVCILGGFLVYISLFASYVVFTTKFSTLKREFTNPLGYTGAAISVAIFGAASYSVVAMQPHSYAGESIAVFLLLATCYYYLVVRYRQRFSPEEQTILFSAYIINANVRTKLRRIKTRRKVLQRVFQSSKSYLEDLSSPFRRPFLWHIHSQGSGGASPSISISAHSDCPPGSCTASNSHKQQQETLDLGSEGMVRPFTDEMPSDGDCVRPTHLRRSRDASTSPAPPHPRGNGQEGAAQAATQEFARLDGNKVHLARQSIGHTCKPRATGLSSECVCSSGGLDSQVEHHGSTIANLIVSTQAILGSPGLAHLLLSGHMSSRSCPWDKASSDVVRGPSRWGILRVGAVLTRKVVPSGGDGQEGLEEARDRGQERLVDRDLRLPVVAAAETMPVGEHDISDSPREMFLNTRKSLNFHEQYEAIMRTLDKQHLAVDGTVE